MQEEKIVTLAERRRHLQRRKHSITINDRPLSWRNIPVIIAAIFLIPVILLMGIGMLIAAVAAVLPILLMGGVMTLLAIAAYGVAWGQYKITGRWPHWARVEKQEPGYDE